MPKVRRGYTRWMKDFGNVLLVSDHKESIHIFVDYQPSFIIHRWTQMRQNQCYARWRGMVLTFQKAPKLELSEIRVIAESFGFDLWGGGRKLGKMKLFGIKDFTNRSKVINERRKNGRNKKRSPVSNHHPGTQ